MNKCGDVPCAMERAKIHVSIDAAVRDIVVSMNTNFSSETLGMHGTRVITVARADSEHHQQMRCVFTCYT